VSLPAAGSVSLPLAGSTFGYLHHRSLSEALDDLAANGLVSIELTPAPPHLHPPALGPYDRRALRRRLDRLGLACLLATAERRGVTLVLENSPYGFLGRSGHLVAIADEIGHPRLRLCYDVADALAQEDPAAGVGAIGARLGLAHVSDTPRAPWRHTSPGRGEVDFAAFAAALGAVGHAAPTVYELVDDEDPAPRPAGDLAALERHGWARR
jgi:sugar phosphate isomerase/epimerase